MRFTVNETAMIVYTEEGNPATILTDDNGNLIVATVRD